MCLQNNVKLDLLFELECTVEAFNITGDTQPFYERKKIIFIRARNLSVKSVIFIALNAWKCLYWSTIYISKK